MDPINQNPNPAQSPVPPNLPQYSTPQGGENHKKIGPIIATLVIVLVLIIAALYIFATKLNQSVPVNPAPTIANVPVNTVQNTPAKQSVAPITNTKDDLQSLQNDLNSSINGVSSQNI